MTVGFRRAWSAAATSRGIGGLVNRDGCRGAPAAVPPVIVSVVKERRVVRRRAGL